MSLKAALEPELPYLRRYARALTGSQSLGDAAVLQMLETLLASPEELDSAASSRPELYRVFHRLWKGTPSVSGAEGLVASLSLHAREALLLTSVEEFSIEETCKILERSSDDVISDIEAARLAISESLQAKVMIIEDESIIALHLASIVESLGHSVAGMVRTRTEAVAMANAVHPELILADIRLADGSSGIEAVKDILAAMDVPVVFITAFPERLLTGERPEPTYLITKPFEPETVTAIVGQALLFHRENEATQAAPANLVMDADTPDPRRHFATPGALLAEPDLTDDDKRALLTEWESELDGRLKAESEGMSASDPISHKREARLADEAGSVKTALTEITERQADA